MSTKRRTLRVLLRVFALSVSFCTGVPGPAQAEKPLVIVASPRLAKPIEAIAGVFETVHPDVRVKIMYASGSFLRSTIARMQNSGRYWIESGMIHIVAPGDAEIIDRLEHRYYVLPGTRQPYAVVRLALVVPAAAPMTTFEEFARDKTKRLAVADAGVSELGYHTKRLLDALGWWRSMDDRIEIAHDAHGILDRLAHGEADAGILFLPQAVQAREGEMKVAALVPADLAPPVVYEMAMERFCPDRALCQEFITFSRSAEARAALVRLGYEVPGAPTSPTVLTGPVREGQGTDVAVGAGVQAGPWWGWFSRLFAGVRPEAGSGGR